MYLGSDESSEIKITLNQALPGEFWVLGLHQLTYSLRLGFVFYKGLTSQRKSTKPLQQTRNSNLDKTEKCILNETELKSDPN